jgi:hypothetical protein
MLFLAVALGVLVALGALAHLIGADSRDQIDDTHAPHESRGSL